MTLTIILLAIGSTLLGLAIASLRRHRLKERYALLLIATGVPFMALAAWPDAVGQLAAWMGIEYHTVLLLAVTTFFLLMIFKLLALVSVQEQRITSLAQIVAILQQELGRREDASPAGRVAAGKAKPRKKDVA